MLSSFLFHKIRLCNSTMLIIAHVDCSGRSEIPVGRAWLGRLKNVRGIRRVSHYENQQLCIQSINSKKISANFVSSFTLCTCSCIYFSIGKSFSLAQNVEVRDVGKKKLLFYTALTKSLRIINKEEVNKILKRKTV